MGNDQITTDQITSFDKAFHKLWFKILDNRPESRAKEYNRLFDKVTKKLPFFLFTLFSASFICIHYLCIPPEEAIMEKTFGAQYTAYKQQVRRWR